MTVEIGQVVTGKVSGITKFGAFVDFGENSSGMVHISEVSNKYTENISDVLAVGDEIKAIVVSNNEGKISLSIKRFLIEEEKKARAEERNARAETKKAAAPPLSEFDLMLNKFKQCSEDKFSDLKKSDRNRKNKTRRH